MKATSLIISEIETKGFITEKEISLLKRRANAGDKEAANFWPCVECTPEQSEKGFACLKNLYKTPNGKERKNNPFGYREMSIIDNYNGELFEFKGFYDAGRYGFHNYLPVYELNGMEYYVCGEIHIVASIISGNYLTAYYIRAACTVGMQIFIFSEISAYVLDTVLWERKTKKSKRYVKK